MPMQDAFDAAKAAMTIYGGFFKDVTNEIGLERALALHAKQGEGFAAALSAATKERAGGGEFDLGAFAAAYCDMAEKGFGMAGETAGGFGSLRTKWARCPVYEGLSAAGLDHETIGRMCQAMSEVECAALSREYPKLSGRLEYRAAADQPCYEEFALAR